MKIHKLEKLENILPLNAPLIIMLEPTNRCTFKCAFCPTGDLNLLAKTPRRPLGDMSIELFKKIIDDLNDFSPSIIKRVQLFKDGESLLHPDIIEMIEYTKKSKVVKEVDITTNASLVDDDMALNLVNSQIDTIRVSFEGSIDNEIYKKITKTDFTYDQIKENFYKLYLAKKKKNLMKPYLEAKIIDTGFSKEKIDKFFNDFKDIADEITVDPLVDRKKLTGKIIKGQKELLINKVCSVPFYNLTINHDGSVSVCCVDWNYTTIVGDLNESSVYDVWHGDKMYEFRKMHVNKEASKHNLCNKCEYMSRLPAVSNIDKLALEKKDYLLDRNIKNILR
jgi:radical SAM protein with 4Fe4S-binding SPASM domain